MTYWAPSKGTHHTECSIPVAIEFFFLDIPAGVHSLAIIIIIIIINRVPSVGKSPPKIPALTPFATVSYMYTPK